jgi:hypothetical protein
MKIKIKNKIKYLIYPYVLDLPSPLIICVFNGLNSENICKILSSVTVGDL